VKKLIVLILFIGLPIMIYLLTIDNKIYYVALGDSLAAGQTPYRNVGYGYADYVAENLKSKNKLAFYTKQFAVSGYRTTDLIHDINTNKKIKVDNKEITIKHALAEADVITISIGINELFYKIGVNNLDTAYYSEADLKKYLPYSIF
jgi:lysophospholipase L1-like esterase